MGADAFSTIEAMREKEAGVTLRSIFSAVADDSFGQAELRGFGSSWETFGLRGLGQCFLNLNVHQNHLCSY